MLSPYYQHNGITIYQADCARVLEQLDLRNVALVLTDPPYGIGKLAEQSSGGKKRDRRSRTHKHLPIHGNYQPFDPTPLLQFKKIILWGANYYADKLPVTSSWFTWDKRQGTTPDDNADGELAWTNLGGPMRIYSHLWRGVCRASENLGGGRVLHPTQKPVALMYWCLQRAKLKPGDLVFDPYMGSGPVAQACKLLGLRYIGVEIEQMYCDRTITHRLSQEVFDLPAA